MLRAAQTTVFMTTVSMATVFMVFVSMGEASAQSTAPGTASDIAQDDRGMAPWPWIIIGLVILGAVIWAYRRRRGRGQ